LVSEFGRHLENVCFCFRSTPTDGIGGVFIKLARCGYRIDLSAPQDSDIRGKHRLKAGTFESAFIVVLLVSEFGRHLENMCFHFRSTPREPIEPAGFCRYRIPMNV
jgi:hypothetical protein